MNQTNLTTVIKTVIKKNSIWKMSIILIKLKIKNHPFKKILCQFCQIKLQEDHH